MLQRNDLDRIEITFDDPRLVANAGLILPVTLAHHLDLGELVDRTGRRPFPAGGGEPSVLCQRQARLWTNQRCHAAIGAPGGAYVVRSPASDIGTSW